MQNDKLKKALKMINDAKKFCLSNNIPMMATIAEETEDGTVYHDEIVTPLEADVTLTDDRISKLNVAFSKGFFISVKSTDMDDLEGLIMNDVFD